MNLPYNYFVAEQAGFCLTLSDTQKTLFSLQGLSYIMSVSLFIPDLPRLVVYIMKVIWQAVSLGLCLLLTPKCGYILLQVRIE